MVTQLSPTIRGALAQITFADAKQFARFAAMSRSKGDMATHLYWSMAAHRSFCRAMTLRAFE